MHVYVLYPRGKPWLMRVYALRCDAVHAQRSKDWPERWIVRTRTITRSRRR